MSKMVGPYIKPYIYPTLEKKQTYMRIIDNIIRNNNSLQKKTTREQLIQQTQQDLQEQGYNYDETLFEQTITILINTGRIHKKKEHYY